MVFRQSVIPKSSGCRFLHVRPQVNFLPRRGMSKVSYYPGNRMIPEYKRDKVPEGYEFIYCKGNLLYFTIGIPAFLITTAVVAGVIAYVFAITQGKKEKSKRYQSPVHQSDSIGMFIVFAAAFLPGLTLLFIKMTKNIMLRIYFNESTNKYYALMLRFGFWRKVLNFAPEEVKVSVKPKNWANISVQGYPMLVHETDFTDMRNFNKFMSSDLNQESEFLRTFEHENMEKLLRKAKEKYGKDSDKEFVRRYIQKKKVVTLEKEKEVKTDSTVNTVEK